MLKSIDRVVNRLDPSLNRIYDISLDEARAGVAAGDPSRVRTINGSFALVTTDGQYVRMARSLDRPMRYFLAKKIDGPVHSSPREVKAMLARCGIVTVE